MSSPNKYAVSVRGCYHPRDALTIDVYSICDAYKLDHKTAHAVKKLLAAGRRGGKDQLQDLKEARWTLDRLIADLEAVTIPPAKIVE